MLAAQSCAELEAVQLELESARYSLESLSLALELQRLEFCCKDGSPPSGSPGGSDDTAGSIEEERHAMQLQVELLTVRLQELKDAEFARQVLTQQLGTAAQQAADCEVAKALAQEEEQGTPCEAASTAGSLHETVLSKDEPASTAILCTATALDFSSSAGWAGCSAVLKDPAGSLLLERTSCPAVSSHDQAQLEAVLLGLRAAAELGLPASWRLLVECGSASAAELLNSEPETQGSVVGGLLAGAQQALQGFAHWEARRAADGSAAGRAAALAAAALLQEENPPSAAVHRKADSGAASEAAPAAADCPICFETMPAGYFHVIGGCVHRYCRGCLGKHILAAVQARRYPVPCPDVGCRQVIDSAECELLLLESPKPDAVATYGEVEREACIPGRLRFYCPDPRCSWLIKLEGAPQADMPLWCEACGGKVCGHCGVVWHKGLSCTEYQALPLQMRQPEDLALLDEARRQHWRQCRRCKHMIELREGCRHITCKCGFEFCYKCGEPWEKVPGQKSQQKCTCALFLDPGEPEQEPLPVMDVIRMWAAARQDAEEEGVRYLQHGANRRPVPDDMPDWVPDRRVPVFKTLICEYWESGWCKRGNRCYFAHGEHELRRFGHYGSRS